MKVHVEVKTWETYDLSEFPEELQKQIEKDIKSGTIKNHSDLCEFIYSMTNETPNLQYDTDTFYNAMDETGTIDVERSDGSIKQYNG